MNSKTNTVRAILLDASECDRPEADHPATIEICADDLQRILERHITEPAQCLLQIAEPSAQGLDAQLAKLTTAYKELSGMFHDQVVAQQAAWIEWKHGNGAEDAMQWIENGLCGPGHIPDEDEPYGKEAQAWFDANKSDPIPVCACGRPSNTFWMGHGFCSEAHYDEFRAAQAKQGEQANG